MAIIAETYIHLAIDARKEFIERSRAYLYHRGYNFANQMFKDKVVLYVRVEDGSYRAWLTVAGAIFVAIANYGSFRSGIDHMVNDARRFSEYVISDFLGETQLQDKKIFRLERRLGMPGRIQRLLRRIDRLEDTITLGQIIDDGKTYVDQRLRIRMESRELKNLKDEIISILEDLDEEKDRELFFHSLPDSVKDEFPEDLSDLMLRVKQPCAIREEDVLEIPDEVRHLPPPE
jgi:hypothetical protein